MRKLPLIIFNLIELILPVITIYLAVIFFPPEWQNRYLFISLFGGGIFVVTANIQGLYSDLRTQNLYQTFVRIYKYWLAIGLLAIVAAFLFRDTENFARNILIVWIFITPMCLFLFRLTIKKISLRTPKYFLVIGDNYSFTQFELKKLEQQKVTPLFLPEAEQVSIEKVLKENQASMIVLNIVKPDAKLISFLTIKSLEGVGYYTIEHFMEMFLRKCYISYERNNLSYLDSIQPYSTSQIILKTLIDYVGAILLLVIASPVMLYTVLKIKKVSPGNALFTQKRVGLKNKEFILIKFRSMHVDAEENGAQFAQENDPRVHRFGQLMRKTRIDELPQVFNIFRKDIHLVGPRAERECFTKDLAKDIPYYSERHIVKPGITGWAQVNYPYGASTEDARQKLMYDLYYIKYWNLSLELETIIKTVLVVLKREGV